jgi:hypothetical protein
MEPSMMRDIIILCWIIGYWQELDEWGIRLAAWTQAKVERRRLGGA